MGVVLYRFTVEGPYPFPVDMLRYDRCWPEREGIDTGAIARALDSAIQRRDRVTLIGLDHPTEGRWRSFGWSVISKEMM